MSWGYFATSLEGRWARRSWGRCMRFSTPNRRRLRNRRSRPRPKRRRSEMLKVEVKITKVRDSDRGNASVIVENQRNGWIRDRAVDVTPGEADSVRTLILEDGQRLVVEQNMEVMQRFDPDQRAVV